MSENTGYAFPSEYTMCNEKGMTLRDYFAAKALGQVTTTWPDQAIDHLSIAKQAYKLADAMMEARDAS